MPISRMKKKSLLIFLIATILIQFYHDQAYNQFEASPIEKSNQKILFQGKTYYVHTVKPGHTIFSICKAYGVTQDDIVSSNPGIILAPLSIGLVLKIPYQNITSPSIVQPDLTLSKSDTNFIYHTVQPKENTYFLHLKYNVPLEEIYKYNPGSETSIQIGQVIRIPKEHVYIKTDFHPEIAQERILRYSVRDGDTLYRIAQTYGLSVEDLINANESLRWGLKTGQILIIPLADEIRETSLIYPDSLFHVPSLARLRKYQCDSIAILKRTKPAIKVAVLLPFFADENFLMDTFSNADTLSGSNRTKLKGFRGRPAAELYEGMLLALDSLKKTNYTISILVYDTEADTNKVKKILGDLDIIEPELIIGPFDGANVRLVSKYSFERKIPFVPPLTYQDSDLLKNPYLFTVIPGDVLLYEHYASYLSAVPHKNVIYIAKKYSKQNEESKLFKKILLNELSSQPEFDSSAFVEVLLDDQIRSNLGKVLKPDSMNQVIIFSTYEPDVISALSHLHFLSRDYPIKVYGLPAWQKFDNVRFDVLHELEVTLYSPFFIDYTENSVKLFIGKCRGQLHSEPYKTSSKGNGINYTYLGYDLTMYFIQAINTYEKHTCDCIEYFNPRLLLSDYNFMRNKNQDGFVNTSVNFITYGKDYTVTKTRSSGLE